jgi:hypothetical protein
MQTFDYPRDNFSISLPGEWTSFPQEKVEAFVKVVETQNSGWKCPAIRGAYVLTNGAELPFAGVVVVAVSDRGEEPEPKKVRKELEMNVLPAGVQKENVRVEDRTNAFVMRGTFRATGYPAMEVWAGLFLTSSGVIDMLIAIPQSSSEKLEGMVSQIIDSVRIAERARFIPPGPRTWTRLIIALAAVAAAGIVVFRAKPAKG